MVSRISRVLLLVCGASWACSGTVGRGAGAAAGSVEIGAGAEAPPPIEPSQWSAPQGAAKGPLAIYTEPGELPHLELATDSKQKLSLQHTHVSAKLTGFVAEVEV